jgi:hypothetical protein
LSQFCDAKIASEGSEKEEFKEEEREDHLAFQKAEKESQLKEGINSVQQ